MSKLITQVNYEALQQIVKDFRQESEAVTQIHHTLTQKVNALQTSWSGITANKFFWRYLQGSAFKW